MIRMDIHTAQTITEALHKAPQIATRELERAMTEAGLYLQREVQERTPVGIGGGGGLKGSIGARAPRVTGNAIEGGVGTSLNYARAVEYGTKPHMPPVQPLRDWARHKLGLSAKEADRAGYLIARKIARKGTQGAHMFEEAFAAGEGTVNAIFARTTERIVQQMGARA